MNAYFHGVCVVWQQQLRELPDTLAEAGAFMTVQLLNDLKEAKMWPIRLMDLKHQTSLRTRAESMLQFQDLCFC